MTHHQTCQNSCCDRPAQKSSCPACGENCTSVSMKTLLHQVQFPLNTQLPSEPFYFCHNPQCGTGYFSESGLVINQTQLVEREKIQQQWLCYCFDISRKRYLEDMVSGEDAETLAFVKEKTESGDCACEVKNPSGKCCLAEFKKVAANHD